MGKSRRCYWACADEHVNAVKKWVSSREEFSGVTEIDDLVHSEFDTESSDDLVHVYVVNENHRAVKKESAWVALTNQPQGH